MMIWWYKANRRYNILTILRRCSKYFEVTSCASMPINVPLEWGLASS